MMSSARDALRTITSELSEELVPEPAQAALAQLVESIPDLGGAQYLECRLGQGRRSAVDFLVSITRFQRQALAARVEEGALAGEGMSPFRRLLAEWTRESSHLHDAVPVAWLEFDDVERQAQACEANVCASIVPSYIDPYVPLTSQAGTELLATMFECITAARGTPCTEPEAFALANAITRLPSGAHWIHLSVMTARKPMELKLYGVFPRHALSDYLSSIGWCGNFAALEHSIANYCPPSVAGSSLYVDLPVNQLLAPQPGNLGLCLSQQQVRGSSEGDPRRRGQIAQLLADGLCSDAQAEALSAWPGEEERRLGQTSVCLERWLDLKLVHSTQAMRLAKAYLGFAVRPAAGSFSLRMPRSREPAWSRGPGSN
jgi:hypothetical protein